MKPNHFKTKSKKLSSSGKKIKNIYTFCKQSNKERNVELSSTKKIVKTHAIIRGRKHLPDKNGGFNEGQPAGLLQKTENVIQRVRVIISLVMTDVENKWSIKTLPFFSKLCTLSYEEGLKSCF